MTEAEIAQIEQYLQHAEAQMLQAEFADVEVRDALYHEAKDLLIRAEKILPGSGAWLMSCMHARTNNGEMCVKWLDRAKKASMLPDVDTIKSHAHFSGALKQQWFSAWVKRT